MTSLRYVMDTNTLSKLVKSPPPPLVKQLRDHSNDTIVVSESVIYEVERGLLKLGVNRQLQTFREGVLPQFVVVPVDIAIWRATAELWAYATKQGRQLADIDLIVAATAVRLNATIVTYDKDYEAFPSLRIEDWVQDKLNQ